MRSSWLYFAVRSVRLALPVLICPAPVATARSAMNVSSVSPERCEMIDAVRAALGELDALERLGERADLVHLDQHRVATPFFDAAARGGRRW